VVRQVANSLGGRCPDILERVRQETPPNQFAGLPACRDRETLEAEIAAWQQRRNRDAGPIDWRFTTADARIKLKRLCPSIDE
jgi:hypothetical protein